MKLRDAIVNRGRCDICGQDGAQKCDTCELILCASHQDRHAGPCGFGKTPLTPRRLPAAEPIRVEPVQAGAKKEVA